jgi:predicted MPP superfamily phosphohydrolase
VILIPAIGLGLLVLSWARWQRLTKVVRVAAIASLGLIAIGVYATWIEPYHLKVETSRLTLPAGREGSKTVKIGVLTDLQTGGVGVHENRAIDLLLAQKPDVILLPGDVFQGTDEEFEATRSALRDLLAKLKAPGGVFLVLGDTDGPGDHLRTILPETSIQTLVNETARVTINGRKLTIGGVQLAYKSDPAQWLVHQLETEPGDGDIRIILAHRPDVALGLRPGSRIDLVVAGHTHGGQIVVPGYGPPMTLSKVPTHVAAGGLHKIGENPIYVSRGVGSERGQAPRVRFLCPPEVSIIELGGPEGK